MQAAGGHWIGGATGPTNKITAVIGDRRTRAYRARLTALVDGRDEIGLQLVERFTHQFGRDRDGADRKSQARGNSAPACGSTAAPART